MKEITVDARTENVSMLTDWINEALEEMGCPMKTVMQFDVAVDEIFSNIAQYAYPEKTGSATVRVGADPEKNVLTITFIDSGIPYDPLQKEDPDTALPAEQRAIGGLGIFMVKKLMDTMSYEYRDGKNIFTIGKRG